MRFIPQLLIYVYVLSDVKMGKVQVKNSHVAAQMNTCSEPSVAPDLYYAKNISVNAEDKRFLYHISYRVNLPKWTLNVIKVLF